MSLNDKGLDSINRIQVFKKIALTSRNLENLFFKVNFNQNYISGIYLLQLYLQYDQDDKFQKNFNQPKQTCERF